MKRGSLFFAAALGVSCLIQPASASSLLADGGFETQGAAEFGGNFCYFGMPASAYYGTCAPSTWTGTPGGGIAVNYSSFNRPNAADGKFYALLQGAGSVSQAFTASSGGSFILNWSESARYIGPNFDGVQRYQVTLADLVAHRVTTIFSGSTTSNEPWTARSSSAFTLNAGGSYKITFAGLTTSGDHTAYIDGISTAVATAAVPEPASWALMIGGFAIAGAAMRRRQLSLLPA